MIDKWQLFMGIKNNVGAPMWPVDTKCILTITVTTGQLLFPTRTMLKNVEIIATNLI